MSAGSGDRRAGDRYGDDEGGGSSGGTFSAVGPTADLFGTTQMVRLAAVGRGRTGRGTAEVARAQFSAPAHAAESRRASGRAVAGAGLVGILLGILAAAPSIGGGSRLSPAQEKDAMPSISSRAARSAATAIALTAAAGAVSSAHSADRLVPQQYATIQAAINASANGDHVVVAPGTYVQSIDFQGKQITVRPSGAALSVTLRAPAGSRAAIFSSGETPQSVLRGFRLAGYGPNGAFGGGVLVQAASPSIDQCEFVDVHSSLSGANWGGALDIASGAPLIQGCTFTRNRASGSGGGGDGGALLVRGGSPRIIRCTFRDNPGSQGSDVFLVSSAPVDAVMSECSFEGVSGFSWGARIYNYGQGDGAATLTLSDCRFVSVAQQCVSLVHGWDSIVMVGVEFDSCTSAAGALVSQSRSRLTVQGCTIRNNSMSLFVCDSAQGGNALVTGTEFCGNHPITSPFGPFVMDGGANIIRVQCCDGDVTGDGYVDGVDLAAVLSSWGTDGQGQFRTDVDSDGVVSGTDLAFVLSGWGPCPE